MAAVPEAGCLKKGMSYIFFSVFIFVGLSGLGVIVFTVLGMENYRSRQILQDVHTSSHLTPSSVKVNFSEHPQYENLRREFDHFCDELLTPNGGFIMTKDDKQVAHQNGLSMFHQLHCLGMLRESFFAATQHRKPNISAEKHLDGPQLHQAHSEHVLHCFDYLRQSIMCCGDLSLEWAVPDRITVDGWNIPHRCQSFDESLL